MVSLALPQSALQNWLRPERSGQLAKLVNVLLVIWLAWLLASLSWLVVPEPESQPLKSPAVAKPSTPMQTEKRFDERQIASWHVFGVPSDDKPVAKKPVKVDAPETRLKLVLRGVFASEVADNALAIVADPKGKEEHYAVGDPLPGGAKLAEIYPDRIILERNGRYETLRLIKDKGGRPSAVAKRSRTNTGNRGNASTNKNKAAAFSKYRKAVKKNPSAFLNYVRATPYRKDGKFLGFKLQAGKERGALKDLGLAAGDIVTAINGVQIDSPAKGMKAMQSLGNGDTVNVTLLRAGKETSMSLTLPSEK